MKIKETIERIFFPFKCPICREIIPIERKECGCQGDLSEKISDRFCLGCGADENKCTCNCGGEGKLKAVAGVYYYGGKIKAQIALFKFGGKKHFANDFALEMSERVARVYSDVKFDGVTFVPSSKESLLVRGFNQSLLLAERIGKMLFVPVEDTLQKIKETECQHGLKAAERYKNLDGAFALKENADVKGKTLLLCDDVMTTGTTLKRCSETLYENGAKEVYCIVFAVTDYMTDF